MTDNQIRLSIFKTSIDIAQYRFIIKSLFFAFIIASVSAFFGYTVDGGSIAVGKASTDAVVSSSVLILFAGTERCRKTTSFYMTVGLITPNEGRIFLDDLEITKYPVYKRAQTGIGYLAQEASVFRQMSVEDNIASVLEMTNKPKEYQKEKLESLIAEFRLQKVRKNKGNQLSGGERRRTEITSCLAIDPKFIMLDEPFAGVDPIAVGRGGFSGNATVSISSGI